MTAIADFERIRDALYAVVKAEQERAGVGADGKALASAVFEIAAMTLVVVGATKAERTALIASMERVRREYQAQMNAKMARKH